MAGVGTNDTRHSVELAEQAAKIGVDGLLIVTPYYNKPPQSGIVAHVNEVVRAGDGTPTMVYDIPGRAGIQIAEDTYVELVKNPLVVAVKDAVGDFERGAWLLRETGIRIYSGDDALTLPWLSIGASGVVGVTTTSPATRTPRWSARSMPATWRELRRSTASWCRSCARSWARRRARSRPRRPWPSWASSQTRMCACP